LGIEFDNIPFEPPPSYVYGELATPICMMLAKKLGLNQRDLALEVKSRIDKASRRFIAQVDVAGPGYLNFYLEKPTFFKLLISSIQALGDEWGRLESERKLKVIVEHTSVNPIHPIGIGHARNSFLGDSIASLLEARGYEVRRHFYIDDVGRQTSILTYGYRLLGSPKIEGKPDKFLGFIYAVTSCILEVKRLKSELESCRSRQSEDEYRRLTSQLDDWVGVAAELRGRDEKIFDKLLESIESDQDPEASIAEMNKLYEKHSDEDIVKITREVVSLCLEGFRETLSRVSVKFDSWDWESELVWSGEVDRILSLLKATPYCRIVESALVFDVAEAARDLGLESYRSYIGIDLEVPPLTLTRADGTTLYTTRDIAYAFRKLKLYDLSITVIGIDQKLPQTQLMIALSALGVRRVFDRYKPLFYGLVKLPSYKMSSRRGRIITLDEVLDEAKIRALIEVRKRSPDIDAEEADRIAEAIAVGAVKYALISVSPEKDITFNWDRVLNFEMNSGPFLQYAYARACSILAKADIDYVKADFDPMLLRDELEEDLLIHISKYPEVVWSSSENLAVHTVAEYANELAMKFNAFYDKLPVLKAEPQGLKIARLKLVYAFKSTLGSALRILGIKPLERM
jgi:arginyl-tRNA synthetase